MPSLKALLTKRLTLPGYRTESTNARSHLEPPNRVSGITATLATQAWLDAHAQDLNGEWTSARLAGLSQREGKSERRCALSTLSALEELRLKTDPHGIYMDNAVQVFTMKGSPLGQLEPAAAALVFDQSRSSNLVRAYVYETQWTQNDCVGVQLALVTWAPFQKA